MRVSVSSAVITAFAPCSLPALALLQVKQEHFGSFLGQGLLL